jgi:aminoglycoside phosphotransferase (APT) family kinase protein
VALPAEAREWVAKAAGARVVRARRLAGGTSSIVQGLDLDDGRRLVLRRHDKPEWLAKEPDVAEREAANLERLASDDVPAPRLVAVDVGRAWVLMTRLEGRVVLRPEDRAAWLAGLEALLPVIHAVDRAGMRPFRMYNAAQAVPSWSARPALWEAAIDAVQRLPHDPTVFVHRDFHPGNVLWSDGRVSGVVDWIEASAGPPGIDTGHCRVNIARLAGVAVARSFGGPDHDPVWDLASAVDALGTGGWGRSDRTERLVALALADLGLDPGR